MLAMDRFPGMGSPAVFAATLSFAPLFASGHWATSPQRQNRNPGLRVAFEKAAPITVIVLLPPVLFPLLEM